MDDTMVDNVLAGFNYGTVDGQGKVEGLDLTSENIQALNSQIGGPITADVTNDTNIDQTEDPLGFIPSESPSELESSEEDSESEDPLGKVSSDDPTEAKPDDTLPKTDGQGIETPSESTPRDNLTLNSSAPPSNLTNAQLNTSGSNLDKPDEDLYLSSSSSDEDERSTQGDRQIKSAKAISSKINRMTDSDQIDS